MTHMRTTKNKRAYRKYHQDGTLWASGWMAGRTMVGHWTWFRKDGTKMRSGAFQRGVQVGKWTTYDRQGRIVRVTNIS